MKNDLMVIADDVKMELQSMSVVMPKNYSFENAVKAAHLILQDTVDKNKKPALEVCTKASIHKAILQMAINGLNPAKMQCYFTVFGNQLVYMVSQYGDVAVAKRVNSAIKDIRAVCIYKNDDIEIKIENGQTIIKKHEQTWESKASGDIIGAYALVIDNLDKIIGSDFMTIEQIKQSWKQSNMKSVVMSSGNVNLDSIHGKFPEEMVKKTILHRVCKPIIRASDDSELLSAWEESSEETPVQARVQREIQQNANKKVIDFKSQDEFIKPEVAADFMDGKDNDFRIESEPGTPVDEVETEAMATTSQARTIVQLEKQARRSKEQTMEAISGFTGRAISRLGELTANEAGSYIDALNEEMKEASAAEQEQDKPAWGSSI